MGSTLLVFLYEVTSHKIKIASLEGRVGSLTSSLDAYKLQRNRFISTFKRDKLNIADRRIIAAGNALVHGGDAVVDASLYSSTDKDGRRDAVAYKRLYGMVEHFTGSGEGYGDSYLNGDATNVTRAY